MGKKIRMTLIFLSAFALVFYALIQYGWLNPKEAGLIALKLKNPDFHYTPWIYVLYVHIVTACLALAIGPFQLFINPVKKGWLRIHRLLGRLYVFSISISALFSVYLSFFATGGWITSLGFFLLDLFWVATTWISISKILQKNIQAHKEWMLRSYALTFTAVSLRLLLNPLMMLGLGFTHAYQLSAWLSWILNLIVIESFIRMRPKNVVSQLSS